MVLEGLVANVVNFDVFVEIDIDLDHTQFIYRDKIIVISIIDRINYQYMSLSLILELKADKKVLVTNSITKKQKEVTLSFLQEATGDSLLMLVQYKYYELLINAEKAWNRIKYCNAEREKVKEIYIEQKFRDIMVNDSWIKITDYEREIYSKALAWVDTYNPKKTHLRNIDKTAIAAAGTGAISGALVSNSIGGIGVAAGGTAFGVGILGLATMGTVAGLAVYGIGKALD
ncbi:MAG: hypothetical protein QNJ41_13810 [Xenococcaceae cyanobacterium MO_188.B32]|nr:hypothetical protein [Xenococcaceae cyanobacterium MO_188.B32]